jgi:type IV secretory pathway VirB10-like protein
MNAEKTCASLPKSCIFARMKAILISLSFLVSVLATGHAANLVTSAGTFKDFKVTRVEAEAVRITHSEGTALVDFDELPPAMQQEYGWTPEKSAARKAAKEAEAKRLAEEERMIDEAPKRRAMEEEAKRKAEEEKQMAADRARRKIENAAFEAESATAQADLVAAAAKARAELDAERAKGKAKPGEVPVATILGDPAADAPDTSAPKRNIVMAPFGTVSDVIGGQPSIFQNQKLWIGAGIGLLVVVILFMLPSGGVKKVRRR